MTDLATRLAALPPKKRELLLRQLAAKSGPVPAPDRIPRQPRDTDRFPVSASQLREWILDRLQPGSGAYNMPEGVRISGPFDIAAFQGAVREVVRRHESLRTTFAESESGEPVQVIATDPPPSAPLVDLSHLGAEQRGEEAQRISHHELSAPFDLERGPLLRVLLLRLGDAEHLVLFTMHHIVSDGWSMGVFFRELTTLYGSFSLGRPSPLPELPVQYADYAVWQRQRLEGEGMARQVDYWRRQLAGVVPLELATDRPRPPMQRFDAGRHLIFFDADATSVLRDLGRQRNASLFMVVLATFAALLSRYTGQEDLTVGTYSGNRNRAELENLIGFFINSLVLRLRPQGETSFLELVDQSRDVTLEAFAHQDIPFERLLEAMKVERDLSRTPLFQVLLALQNFPVTPVELTETRIEPLPMEHDHSDYDLSLWMMEWPQGLAGTFLYAAHLFEPATVARMGDHLLALTAGAVAEPERPLRDLPLLSVAERRQLLEEWGVGGAGPETGERLEALIAARAAADPGAVALEWDGGSLTHGDLRGRAAALAGRLRSLGVGPEVLVALAAERSPEMIVGLLAVLEAGGAYLPLDPAYPEARLAMMMEDSGASVLLTQARLVERIPSAGARVVLLDEGSGDGMEASPAVPFADPDHPAYVIYTSGSTGRPKGVMVAHRSIAAYARNAAEAFGLGPDDRVLQFASISFDTSGEEIWPALASGATLVLRPDDMASSIDHFLRELDRLRITVLDLPTAFWHEVVLGLGTEGELPSCVRLVILGGEKALPERLAQWRERVGPGVRLLNTYGPTEATIVATRRDLTDGPATAPIGRPIPGARAHVLDRWGSLAPVGVPGELLVGGVGLARGYLRRPDITAERFVPDPFGPSGSRLYRTGDLVRWRSSGDLEFLGRVDHQIKIRGFRVELGEIEAALRSLPQVRDAAVLLRSGPGGDPRLVGYLVREEGTANPLPASELRAALQQRLPEYMVPALFVDLPALPLTPSGKVDRRALPEPEAGRPDLGTGYVAPRNELERKIAAVWRELLGVDRIGTEDNLFDLGAHSLLIVRAHSRLKQVLERDITVIDLFRHPSVGALARHLSRQEEKPSFQQVQTLAQQQKSALSRQRQAMERLKKPGGSGPRR